MLCGSFKARISLNLGFFFIGLLGKLPVIYRALELLENLFFLKTHLFFLMQSAVAYQETDRMFALLFNIAAKT